MTNPFNDSEDDETGREIQAEIERLERERLERERLAALDAEPEEAVYEGEQDVVFAEDEQRLRLGDDEERLPWLESDDDYTDDSVNTGRIATVALLGLLAVLAIVGLAWWLSRDTPDAELMADGSTIEAPDEPFRARPENPGGTAAEGTGDVSYEVGEGEDRETQVAAATPTPTPTATASAAAARPSIDRNQSGASASATGGVGVQVAAFPARANAEAAWAQISRRHAALSGANHRVVEAQVDGNTVYRLQAVASNAAAATALCNAIKADGGDCLIAR